MTCIKYFKFHLAIQSIKNTILAVFWYHYIK